MQKSENGLNSTQRSLFFDLSLYTLPGRFSLLYAATDASPVAFYGVFYRDAQ